ncbi:MAG: VOC family protein [Cyclobacteriaceae bacterium]|nr:VOC family protein [Cyclobacteriaceae bacterium]
MIIVTPILRIFDYSKAVEFYVDWLGFNIDWEHALGSSSPRYIQISRGDLILHLTEHHNDCSPGARIHIENFEGLAEYHRLLIARNYKYISPGIGRAFWDKAVIKMDVIDPFRSILTLTENKTYKEI